jgi:hypothetical protein
LIIASFRKDADATNDYTVNFDTVLEPDGERLTSVVWTVPPGITLGSGQYGPAVSSDGRKASLWLRNGTAGVGYVVNGHYVTDNVPPREDDVQIFVGVV